MLKDVVLIVVEAVDLDVKAQKAKHRKRKFESEHEDPDRLLPIVDDLFAKLETDGEQRIRPRFSKKKRL